eukprot:Awhi_evm1s1613
MCVCIYFLTFCAFFIFLDTDIVSQKKLNGNPVKVANGESSIQGSEQQCMDICQSHPSCHGFNLVKLNLETSVTSMKYVEWHAELRLERNGKFAYYPVETTGGKITMTRFEGSESIFLHPKVGASKKNDECVTWHEKVVLSNEAFSYEIEGNWYGNLVGHMDYDTGEFTFSHGGQDPSSFYIRPPFGETRDEHSCLLQYDKFVLAYTEELDRDGFGWGGARVAQIRDPSSSSSELYFGHGRTDPDLFSFVEGSR